MKHIEEQGFDDVIAMVPQCDFGDVMGLGVAIQHPSSQSRAQAAHRISFGNDSFDHAVGILLNDVVRHVKRT